MRNIIQMRQVHKSLCTLYWGYKAVYVHPEVSLFEESFFSGKC